MEKNKHEILLGLTTTPASDWRRKVEEMKKFGIKRIALFPTFLNVHQRKELYSLLETVEDLQIPHIHLRSQDTEAWEMEWFEKHGAVAYNVHMGTLMHESLKPFRHKIYVENHIHKSIPREKLEECAGICLDFQHWQRAKKQHPSVAEKTENYAKEFVIGCCHMSALPNWKNSFFRLTRRVGGHYMISLNEMNYLTQFSEYFPRFMSIELENSFEQQLEVKEHLEQLLNI